MKKLFFLLLLPIFFPARAQVLEELENLNSPFRETNLSITPNGKYLYFMSDRGGQSWSEKRWDNWSVERKKQSGPAYRFDGDIWFSRRVGEGWSDPVCLGKVINTSNGEDEPNISADGQRVYFQSWDNWVKRNGPYYMARLDGTRWKKPVGLGGGITLFFMDLEKRAERQMVKDLREAGILEKFMILRGQGRFKEAQRLLAFQGVDMNDYAIGTDGMAISPDERSMVLSVYVPERKGFDLYFSQIGPDGNWTYPRGMNINTSQDEVSAFIASDNRTLYFASDRPGGFGGYDIYKTSMEPNGRCSKPQNLGPVYNKSTDEYGFIIDGVKGTGFLVSNGDIFEISLEEEARPEQSILINGRVLDPKGKPLAAEIYLIHKSTRDTLSISASNSLSGEYAFAFRRENGSYNQVAVAPNGKKGQAAFLVEPGSKNSLDFVITIGTIQSVPPPSEPELKSTPPLTGETKPDPAPAVEEKPQTAPPAPPSPAEETENKPGLDTGEGDVLSSSPKARGGGDNNTFIINNVQFDADKTSLKTSSFTALNKLAQILRSKPELKFEIGGHTNILPPEDYCQQLSEERAKSVYDYLILMGVPSEQLTFKGYGKSQPIESDKDLEKQKVNQRVEIKILD